MSERNRLRNYALGLIAGLIIAFGIGSQFWTPANQLDTSIQRQASKNASEQAKRSDIAVREECAAVLAPPEKRDCIASEAQPYREAERNERDLEAQQVVAIWTRVMGKAAIIGMGVGIVGLFLIFTTFWETRQAAQAGFEANRLTARAQRPWLDFEVKAINALDRVDDALVVRIIVNNLSSYPAHDVRAAACGHFISGHHQARVREIDVMERLDLTDRRGVAFPHQPHEVTTRALIHDPDDVLEKATSEIQARGGQAKLIVGVSYSFEGGVGCTFKEVTAFQAVYAVKVAMETERMDLPGQKQIPVIPFSIDLGSTVAT